MTRILIKDIGLLFFMAGGAVAIWYNSVIFAMVSLIGCSLMFIEHIKYLNKRINAIIDMMEPKDVKHG